MNKFKNYKAPSYEKVKKEIDKKIGTKPKMPSDLSKGEWSEQALKVLGERYLVKDTNLNPIETPEEMVWRVAWEVASSEARWGAKRKDVTKSAREFYELMISKKFLPNSPTLMNAGTGNGLQYSACFVLPVEDSMEGIFDALKYQAIIHKTGGGTGFSFTRLRPSGSLVKTSSGTASGPISFMRIFDAATNEVKQGGKRRGANMGILRVDHPDVMEFIHCKEEGGITNFNISVAITDAFMEAYRKDEEYDLISPKTKEVVGKLSAKKVFDEIAEGAWRTGDPGLVFIDKINKSTANPVPAIGEIEATNPCVTGDTLVSTDSGLLKIENIYKNNLKVRILSDSRLSDVIYQVPTKVLQTGEKQ
ncbi:MAG: ribonucleotide reductase N-terminal alpha domain-containing protein, partial [Candidatus Woesebacteria bacterium]|nr:ribonucleotide reductase N-terminal alpha domain-containing protein [Candidatus Woesebacteria bacterium]